MDTSKYTEERILAEIEICQDSSQRLVLILLLQTQRNLALNTESTLHTQGALAELESKLEEPLAIYRKLKDLSELGTSASWVTTKLLKVLFKLLTVLLLLFGLLVSAVHGLAGNTVAAKEITRSLLNILTGKL